MRGGFKLVKRKDAKYYYITWTEGGKSKRVSTGCADRADAEKWFAGFILEIQSPTAKDPSEALLSLILDDYWNEHAPRTLSKRTIEAHIVTLKKFFGEDKVSSISRQRIREFIDQKRKEGLSDGTTRRYLTTFSAALNFAKKEGRLTVVPYIDKPASPPARERWLTNDEVARLLAACVAPHLRLFIMLALYTAQRKRAILELKWSQVDFKSGMIDFAASTKKVSSKRRVTVPINDELQEALEKARREADSDYVVSYKGERIKSDILRGFYAVVERAFGDGEIKTLARKTQGISPHTLRHTAATWMALNGVDLFLIAKVLGQSVQRTTEMYAKYHPEHLRRAVNAIGGISARNLPNGGPILKTAGKEKAAQGG